jgi:hypothetical protein
MNDLSKIQCPETLAGGGSEKERGRSARGSQSEPSRAHTKRIEIEE